MYHERIAGPIDGTMDVVEEIVSFRTFLDKAGSSDVAVHGLQHSGEAFVGLCCGNNLILNIHAVVHCLQFRKIGPGNICSIHVQREREKIMHW